jgi:hypothetical protein
MDFLKHIQYSKTFTPLLQVVRVSPSGMIEEHSMGTFI